MKKLCVGFLSLFFVQTAVAKNYDCVCKELDLSQRQIKIFQVVDQTLTNLGISDDEKLVYLAVGAVESSFTQTTVTQNRSGGGVSVGVMQINTKWWGPNWCVQDVRCNTKLGVKIIRTYGLKFDDFWKGVRAYNVGPAKVHSSGYAYERKIRRHISKLEKCGF